MHVIAILAFDQLVAADLAVPCELFGRAVHDDGAHAYEVRVCSVSREIDAGPFVLRAPWDLRGLDDADTILVPGKASPTDPPDPLVVAALRQAADRGARIVSICTGAFTLAFAGLLDGRRATTHWLAADELARRFPEIQVDPGVLFIDSGDVLTSAGAAAVNDLCLHLIRRDFGAEVARQSARAAVMPLERDGGQAQFIVHPAIDDDATLAPLLEFVGHHLDGQWSLEEMATQACTTVRTLNRRFREQTGTTPAKWLARTRLRRAQQYLEATDLPIERIAPAVGFGSVTTFRDHFRRQLGTSPRAYRRSFRDTSANSRAA